ncbi:MAG: rod shape-determining protein MreC [Gudongella sp.]|nr:rod shape-determining protein MreC [Gudongella sp.]
MYFFRKYKERMIVTLVAIILLIIIGITNNNRESMTFFEKSVGSILSPITNASSWVTHGIGSSFNSIKDTFEAKSENKLLKENIKILESENRDLNNIIGKTDYLKKEQEMLKNSNYSFIKASVSAKEPGNWYDKFTIDKGSADGIAKDDTVIAAIEVENNIYQEGLVGKVLDVGTNWAKVATIIDELNSVSFKIIRTGDGGVVSGTLDSSLEGFLYDFGSDVIVGDKLYTSGLGEVYLKDLYLGEVSEVLINQEELTKRIIIKPAIDFKKIYNVYIIAK